MRSKSAVSQAVIAALQTACEAWAHMERLAGSASAVGIAMQKCTAAADEQCLQPARRSQLCCTLHRLEKVAPGLHDARTWTLNSSEAMCSPPHREVATTDSTIAQGMLREALRVSSANWVGASYPAHEQLSDYTPDALTADGL